jgi:hypothetical protein
VPDPSGPQWSRFGISTRHAARGYYAGMVHTADAHGEQHRLLTIPEAAKLLGVHPNTVKSGIKRGWFGTPRMSSRAARQCRSGRSCDAARAA